MGTKGKVKKTAAPVAAENIKEATQAGLGAWGVDRSVGVALAPEYAQKEVDRRPSKAERRAKLIAAHVAIDAVRYDIDEWTHREGLQNAIAAAIGRLELRD